MDTINTCSEPQGRAVAKRFLVLFMPLLLAVVALGWIYHWTRTESRQAGVSLAEKGSVAYDAQLMSGLLEMCVDDTRFLAELVSKELYGYPGDRDSREIVANAFEMFSSNRPDYLQVRLLDATGRESLRMDHHDDSLEIVPKSGLQDKSDRDYFQEGIRLSPGQVHVSRFDLNIEQGKIEVPYVPTLRLSSPVTDASGAVRGLVVLNFKGSRLLERLGKRKSLYDRQVFLLDNQGHWLMGPEPELEWGGVIGERSDRVMANLYPRAWEAISRESTSQVVTQNGLFTFARICPDALPGKLDIAAAECWIIASRVEPAVLAPPLNINLAAMLGGLIVLLGATAWLWAVSRTRRAEAEAVLTASEARMRAMGESALDAMVIIDANDFIVYFNPAAEQLFGIKRKDARGNKFHTLFVRPEDKEEADKGLASFSKDGKGQVLGRIREVTAIHADGATFPAEVAVAGFSIKGKHYAAGAVRDITERVQHLEELSRLATTDPLTGLLNRRRFMEILEAETIRAKRYPNPLSILYLDIDHFKKINDTYGHDAGDDVLRHLASLGLGTLRETDYFGRLGGEEFAIILTQTELEQACKAAERLRSLLAEAPLTTRQGLINATISIGVAHLEGETDSPDRLLRRADSALYSAKEKGRNRVQLAAPMRQSA